MPFAVWFTAAAKPDSLSWLKITGPGIPAAARLRFSASTPSAQEGQFGNIRGSAFAISKQNRRGGIWRRNWAETFAQPKSRSLQIRLCAAGLLVGLAGLNSWTERSTRRVSFGTGAVWLIRGVQGLEVSVALNLWPFWLRLDSA